MWSLAVSNEEDRVVTGAGDSVIHIWKDYTLLHQEEEKQKTEQTIMKEQELLNAIHNRQYLRAFKAAFALDQPHRILTLVEEMLADEEFEGQLESLIAGLSLNDIEKLLGKVKNSKLLILGSIHSRLEHQFEAQRSSTNRIEIHSQKFQTNSTSRKEIFEESFRVTHSIHRQALAACGQVAGKIIHSGLHNTKDELGDWSRKPHGRNYGKQHSSEAFASFSC